MVVFGCWGKKGMNKMHKHERNTEISFKTTAIVKLANSQKCYNQKLLIQLIKFDKLFYQWNVCNIPTQMKNICLQSDTSSWLCKQMHNYFLLLFL